jgi:hypothetical protein
LFDKVKVKSQNGEEFIRVKDFMKEIEKMSVEIKDA